MDAYRISVSIALANGMSPVLAIIGKDLLGLKTTVGAVEQSFGKWATAIGGFGSVLAGVTVLGAMTKLAEKAADFQDAMTKVSQLSPKIAQLVQSGDIKNMAFGVGTQLGMQVEDVTKIYGGIYGVLQDPEEAEALTPVAARYARLMQMRHPGSHPEESINTLMRAGELSGRLTDDKGAIDPQRVKEWFDTAARLEAATHGQVNAESLLGLAQQGGGVALRGLSQEGYEHMAIVAQMMGGQRAGTSLLSLRSQLSGTMMKRSAQAMQDYGLLKDDEWSSEGGHVQISEAAQKRLVSLVSTDPMKFVNELVDRLEAKGITNKDEQMTALQRILGRQTTQRMVADMLLARQQISRETAGLEQGATVEQGLAGYTGNIHGAQQAMGNAWHNLMVAIGGPEGERFAAFLNKIAGAVNSATGMVNRLGPEKIDQIFNIVMGIGAGLIVLGGIFTGALITTLLSVPALIGAALSALVAMGVALAAFNWDSISGFMNMDVGKWFIDRVITPFANQVTADFTHYGQLVNGNWDRLSASVNGIVGAISGFIDKIIALYERVKGIFSTGPQTPEQKQFQKDLDSANKNYVPMRFNPGTSSQKSMQAAFSLNVDGQALAQSVIDHLEALYGMPTGAPSSDGVSSPFSGDHQYGSV